MDQVTLGFVGMLATLESAVRLVKRDEKESLEPTGRKACLELRVSNGLD